MVWPFEEDGLGRVTGYFHPVRCGPRTVAAHSEFSLCKETTSTQIKRVEAWRKNVHDAVPCEFFLQPPQTLNLLREVLAEDLSGLVRLVRRDDGLQAVHGLAQRLQHLLRGAPRGPGRLWRDDCKPVGQDLMQGTSTTCIRGQLVRAVACTHVLVYLFISALKPSGGCPLSVCFCCCNCIVTAPLYCRADDHATSRAASDSTGGASAVGDVNNL